MSVKVSVDGTALRQVLMALIGPSHLIRELQATRGLKGLTDVANPIDVLLEQFNAEVARIEKEQSATTQDNPV